MTSVGVVVPFYQREAGLLHKALASVLAQALPHDVQLVVVVVDDASPCPPDADLAGLGALGRHRLITLSRPNGGPGAARNAGLDYLSAHPVDFVAFIDSDDAWRPHHLTTALASLGEDGDFFFADHERPSYENELSYFGSNTLIQQWLNAPQNGPLEQMPEAGAYRVRKDWGILPFMQDYLAQTSTVVYRHAPMAGLRFDPMLRIAGEDRLFWLSLAKKARSIRLSTQIAATCGSGVNVYHSTLGWDHPSAPARFAYQLIMWRYVRDHLPLTKAERTLTEFKIAGFARGFSYIWLRNVVRTGKVDKPLIQLLGTMGWRGWRIIPAIACVLGRKATGQVPFLEH